jgi:hypothetical protein
MGPQGEEGLEGPCGPMGEEGPRGPSGGPPGVQGEPGIQGERGVVGHRGLIGQGGPQGVKGVSGYPGSPGANGCKGDPGVVSNDSSSYMFKISNVNCITSTLKQIGSLGTYGLRYATDSSRYITGISLSRTETTLTISVSSSHDISEIFVITSGMEHDAPILHAKRISSTTVTIETGGSKVFNKVFKNGVVVDLSVKWDNPCVCI